MSVMWLGIMGRGFGIVVEWERDWNGSFCGLQDAIDQVRMGDACDRTHLFSNY
jgi:hypothetical protein